MTTDLVVALTSHIFDEPAPIGGKTYRAIRDSAEEDVVAWAEKWLSPQDATQVAARVALIEQVETQLAQLSDEGIIAITEFDDRYPNAWHQKLANKKPPVIFVAGNPELLQTECVAVVGSRDVDEEGEQFAKDIAAEIVRNGWTLCSGGARGVDQIAMQSAHEAGGNSIGILADSLSKSAKGNEAIDSGRVCLATPFSPSAGFSVGNAMGRNKLVYALSKAAVIVSSATNTGGTWAGATEALTQNLCKVLARYGDQVPEGNRELIRKGATALATVAELSSVIQATATTARLF